MLFQLGVDRRQVGAVHMRQDHVLLVADAQLVMAILAGQIGHHAHLLGCGVAGGRSVRFERDRHDGIPFGAVRGQVGVGPGAEHRIVVIGLIERTHGFFHEIRGFELGLDAGKVVLIDAGEQRFDQRETLFHQTADFVQADLVHGDLDAGLVFVVAAADLVPDADDAFQIGQQVFFGQEVVDDLADHRRAAQTATDQNLVADHTVAFDDAQADVMGADHGAVVFGAGHGHLELARHRLEFWVIGGPLAHQFGHGARVGNLVGGGTGEMVCGHVADGVARGLNRVHLHFAQGVQHIRHIPQFGPVVLNILACGEVAVTLVPFLGQIGQLIHLAAGERAIGDRHAQHVGVQLQVQPVHQAQRLEFVLGQAAVDTAFNLRAELAVALGDEGGVEIGIGIHQFSSVCLPWA